MQLLHFGLYVQSCQTKHRHGCCVCCSKHEADKTADKAGDKADDAARDAKGTAKDAKKDVKKNL
jgi:hypothetical protein